MENRSKKWSLFYRILVLFLVVSSFSIFGNHETICAKNKFEVTNFSGDNLVIKKGKSFTLKVKKGPYKKITYKCSNAKIAKVSKKGVITAKKKGTGTISILNGKKVIKKIKFTVGTPISKIKSSTSVKVYVNSKVTLKTKINPKNATYKKLSYSSNDKKTAIVNKKGIITGIKEGTAKVTIKTLDGSNKKNVVNVNVYPVNKYEKISQQTKSLETKQLSDTIMVKDTKVEDDTKVDVALSGLVRVDSSNKPYIFVDQKDKENTDKILENIQSISAVYYAGYSDVSGSTPLKASVSGRKWYIQELPLDIGTTNLKITIKLSSGVSVDRIIHCTRTNNTYTYSDKVFKLDEDSDAKIFDKTQKELIQEFYDGIYDYKIDDNGTNNDVSDDKIIAIFNENCWFVNKLKNTSENSINKGTYLAINSGSVFKNGFSYKISDYYDHVDFIKYPSNQYEVVVFSQINSWDMLSDKKEVCFDQSGTIDNSNPVAFAYSDFEGANNTTKNRKKGNEGKTNFKYKYEKNGNVGKLTIYGSVVIYDKDGNTNTTDDQVTVDFTYVIDDLSIENCFEWHPIKNKEALPEQVMMRLCYSEKTNVSVNYSVKLDGSAKELIDKLRDKKDTDKSVLGFNISGVDDDDIVLGYVGINLDSLTPGENVGDTGLDAIDTPTAVFAIVTNLEGSVKIKGKAGYEKQSYYVKGANIQKNGFEGKYGSVADNRIYSSSEEYIDFADRYVQFFDLNGKSKTSPNLDPVAKIYAKADIEGNLKFTFGAAVMLRMFEITPAAAKAEFYYEINGKGTLAVDAPLGGDIKLSKNYDGSIAYGIDVEIATKIKVENDQTNKEISKVYRNKKQLKCVESASSQKINVGVYKYDGDDDVTNDVSIEGALVELTPEQESNPTTVKLTYDNNSKKYVNKGNGDIYSAYWTIKISKDGYETHEEKHVNIGMSDMSFTYYLAPNSNSTISGSVKTISSDGAKRAEGVTVTMTSTGGNLIKYTVTDSRGEYEFKNVPVGTYVLTYVKTGYVSSTKNVEVKDAETNYSVTQVNLISSSGDEENITGKIKNSRTGNAVPSRDVYLIPYFKSDFKESDIWKRTTSDSEGNYSFSNIPAGYYTVATPTADGFLRSFQFVMTGDEDNENNILITPILNGNEFEVKLSWGKTPEDLDLHLQTNLTDSNKGNYHIYFSNKNSDYDDYDDDYNDDKDCRGRLDVDDMSSYGPETITIYSVENGVYTFYIHDYTNIDSNSSSELADSGASVVLSLSDGTVRTYDVPNKEGTLWKVFSYNTVTKEIIDINEVTYCSSEGDIGSEIRGTFPNNNESGGNVSGDDYDDDYNDDYDDDYDDDDYDDDDYGDDYAD